MSDRKLAKTIQDLFKQIWRSQRSITKALVTWLLRIALIVNRRNRHSVAGFVLPTTVLLVLVVALTAGALSYRAFNTSTRTIAETQNRIIYNAATPAIDRARAKVEFLFDDKQDTRYPGGVPSDGVLTSMMLNAATPIRVKGAATDRVLKRPGGGDNGLLGNNEDPYTLPNESRVDINRDGQLDNAWLYRTDTNGDGTLDATVVYSILLTIPSDQTNGAGQVTRRGSDLVITRSDTEKADGEVDPTSGGRRLSYTRSGPLSNASAASGCAVQGTTGSPVEGGWYPDLNNTAVLRKNFQVDAFVVPDGITRGAASNFTTLEFQQDRVLERGNKWGAWFRNDLEIFPGPPFQWNGAMHTEGSLIIGNNSFSAYLISSPGSCLYSKSASEISVTSIPPGKVDAIGNPLPPFTGVIASGLIGNNTFGGSSLIYLHSNTPKTTEFNLVPGTDWATGASPLAISSNPVAIQVSDIRQARGPGDTTNAANFAIPANGINYPDRFPTPKAEPTPYVDDLYRADNRYGPKFKYNDAQSDPTTGNINQIPSGVAAGSPIPAIATKLIGDTSTTSDGSGVGLDGYWERRARTQGLRVLVGQRLELGNTNGWEPPIDRVSTRTIPPANTVDPYLTSAPAATGYEGDGRLQFRRALNATTPPSWQPTTDGSLADPTTSDSEGDPLYPPYTPGTSTTLTHEAIQRRTLRDNVAAVQATAVYHAASSTDYPVACLASTSHPGTPYSLRQSVNFVPTYFVNSTPAGLPGSAGGLTSQQDTILLTDFFNGRGTNGWEFEPPLGTQAQFELNISNPDSSIRIALKNLAQFAGDHVNDNLTGAFPPTQEGAGGRVHPFPLLSMWGNYANLRRTIAQLEGGTAYNSLSPADKTYLQTAACTLGMLAYNIDRVQRFDPRNPFNDNKTRPGLPATMMTRLADDLFQLMDGEVNEAAGDFEVLPVSQLGTYQYGVSTTFDQSRYNPRDYDRVPAEAFLGKLREVYAFQPASAINDAKLRLAELIFEYFQVRRDRTYGFRASPASNTWNYNPFVTSLPGTATQTKLWSSACDPNMFALNAGPAGQQTGPFNGVAQPYNVRTRPEIAAYRLALSRLCGTVIPPAGAREAPGDTGLPARNAGPAGTASSSVANALDNIPKLQGSNTFVQGASWTPSPPSFTGTSPLNQAPYNQNTELPYLQATVAPKWPSLYYLFPEFNHGQSGAVFDQQGDGIGTANADGDRNDDIDHRQPTGLIPEIGRPLLPLARAFQPWPEPYITDTYISGTVNNTATYRVVDAVSPAIFPATSYPTYTTADISYTDLAGSQPVTYRYRSFNPFPDDRPVSAIALRPRRLPAGGTNPIPLQDNPAWLLPALASPPTPPTAAALTAATPENRNGNVNPNRILVPSGDRPSGGQIFAVSFLDRVMFNGRESMPTRTMDLDIGLLRRTRIGNDTWLPISGIVYAFREDATREDAINRPVSGTRAPATPPSPLPQNNATGVSDLNTGGGTPSDPPMLRAYPAATDPLISVKSVDGIPDPDRRPHGFRLRNGSQLKRIGVSTQDNIRGLSFFTDNPVYIMGDYNLHRGGNDDTTAPRIEEFLDLLPDTGAYNEDQFYDRRADRRDPNFAKAQLDRWRPSEILADSISVLSDVVCDGSLLDGFMTAGSGSGANLSATTYSGRTLTDSNVAFPAGFFPYNSRYGAGGSSNVYNNLTAGLYGLGCNDNRTTFLNQNRPSSNARLGSGTTGWAWARENPADIFSPVKVSRNGDGFLIPNPPVSNPAPPATQPAPTRPVIPYTANPVNGTYYNLGNDRPLENPANTRVNTIVVSGLVPSQPSQSYGGLHNFPRFLESWGQSRPLWFSGSFLQLNFSNYGTAPFSQNATAWEPGSTAGNETIGYYDPPNRLWGYDVALQLAPAGPAASRFITPGKERSEFYTELPANDPYIRNLCRALPDDVIPDNRCPT